MTLDMCTSLKYFACTEGLGWTQALALRVAPQVTHNNTRHFKQSETISERNWSKTNKQPISVGVEKSLPQEVAENPAWTMGTDPCRKGNEQEQAFCWWPCGSQCASRPAPPGNSLAVCRCRARTGDGLYSQLKSVLRSGQSSRTTAICKSKIQQAESKNREQSWGLGTTGVDLHRKMAKSHMQSALHIIKNNLALYLENNSHQNMNTKSP